METTFPAPFKTDSASLVTALAYSPDGKSLATAYSDKAIRIWETGTGHQIGDALYGHSMAVSTIAYAPNGRRLVSGSSDSALRVWDTSTYRRVVGPARAHVCSILAAQCSPDETLIASGDRNGYLKFWNARTGACVATIKYQPPSADSRRSRRAINSLSFSPSGKQIVTASDDCHIRIYDVHRHKLALEPIAGHKARVKSVEYSPSGTVIASASDDHTICLWNASTGELIRPPLRSHEGWVTDLSFSSDGVHLVSGSADRYVRIWDVAEGKCVLGPLIGHRKAVVAVACSPDGEHFASCDQETVRIWSICTGEAVLPLVTADEHNVLVAERTRADHFARAVAWFPDGLRFASGGHDRVVRLWNAQSGEESSPPLVSHLSSVTAIDISSDGAFLASGSDDFTVCIWDLKHGELVTKPLRGHFGNVFAVKFIPGGTHLASGGIDKMIRIWDTQTGTTVDTIEIETKACVNALSVSSDGSRLASGHSDTSNRVQVWDLRSNTPVAEPFDHSDEVLSVALSPDGSLVLSGTADTVRLWDISRREQLFSFKHGDSVRCVHFSTDSAKFLSASYDMTVRVWDTGSRSLIHSLQHSTAVRASAFSPDGLRVLSGCDETRLTLWDTISGQKLLPKGTGKDKAPTSTRQSNIHAVPESVESLLNITAAPRRRLEVHAQEQNDVNNESEVTQRKGSSILARILKRIQTQSCITSLGDNTKWRAWPP
ncbi:WD40 repeat-like protein [Coniophora puteana RWD-64-598 SS2]|uniref:WD40 repeat-like protein n=1 Tax=Coniophora puteana (strain RWD-64-598) TaxID=741705 RepID=A0A5M3MAD3_CONPW|nr:WD40 repeat-like protein [Coniophora puteana RWD-64-598 SS2]EIW75804.1 WD40 repeat-like protein [Coniophora puteana RWD-64-598 SS2]